MSASEKQLKHLLRINTGQYMRGKKHSLESRKKMSIKRIGRKPNLGKKHSKEARIKMSLKRKGRKFTMEHRKKIGESHKGKKCNFWKGGIAPINQKIRDSFEYTLWRTAVFRRDKWTCIWCGKRGGWSKVEKRNIMINADHIQEFSKYPELRFAIDNGRTLCRECHIKRHKKGYAKN